MARKKGRFANYIEYAKHLRKWGNARYWRSERRRAKNATKQEAAAEHSSQRPADPEI